MESKAVIAVEIAVQTHVLKCCPVHQELFCDDDVDPSAAFALAVDLVRQHMPYVRDFNDDPHALTDLLSDIIGAAPNRCPLCARGNEPLAPRLAEKRARTA
jgi:hypothetical protein